MSVIATALKHLIAAGVTGDALVAAVADMEASQPKDAAAERRRAWDRERKREAKASRSGGIPVDSAESVEKVEPAPLSLPPKENNQTPPPIPPDNTPREAHVLAWLEWRKANPFPCPAGVDPVDWRGLIANRKAQKAPLSEGAHRQIIRKLQAWTRDGWPPGPIVATAAERGWRTVFETDEMKGSHNGHHHIRGSSTASPDRRSSLARAIDEGLANLQ